jgi:hypothetical protein
VFHCGVEVPKERTVLNGSVDVDVALLILWDAVVVILVGIVVKNMTGDVAVSHRFVVVVVDDND